MCVALFVGWFPKEGEVNTSFLRFNALCKLVDKVDKLNMYYADINLKYRVINRLFRSGLPLYLPDLLDVNKEIIRLVKTYSYDLIWIEKGLVLYPSTLREIKKIQPNVQIVGYSPDLMTARHNQSLQFIKSFPYYDCYVTTKSYAVDDMYKLGCKKVIYQGNAYLDDFHYPREISEMDYQRLAGDIGFIGAWEEERAESILYLVQHGVPVRIWGDKKWLQYQNKYPLLKIEGAGLFTDDYCIALSAFKISLCFLRKMNFDQQTQRSIEIPACQGFMLAERTQEHLDLFEENKEACYFSSNEELLETCKYYLQHEEERLSIAKAGRQRCINSGYSYVKRIKSVLNKLNLI